MVEVGENRFFSEGNNIGVDFATGDFIVFLNNDAFVEPGWIEELAATMQDDPMVAAVGPMFLYPDGRVQEVGSLALSTGDVMQVGKGSVWGPDHYDTPCVVDFCSAACLLMRRSDFLEVGGFGFEWEPAYYEDVDLCLKLWTTCGKVVVNPRARVVHIESKTTSDSRLRLDDISEINRPALRSQMGTMAGGPAHGHLGDLPARRSTCRWSMRHVRRHREEDSEFVLYSPYPLVPGGGERVLFELASHFRTLVGISNVTFCTPERYSSIRMRQISSAFGFEDAVATAHPWDEVDPSRCRFSVVLGNRSFRRSPPSVGAASINCNFRSPCPTRTSRPTPSCWPTTTRSGCTRTSCGETSTDFCSTTASGRFPSGSSRPRQPGLGRAQASPWADRRTILTVGRFFAGGHLKRQDVVIDVFRQLVQHGLEDFELAVAGSIHPGPEGRKRYHELQALAEGLPCTFHPNVARDDLAALYGRSAILVHAAGYGVDPDEFPESSRAFWHHSG